MITKIVMPPLGETMDEGTIIMWLKKVGDPVEWGDPLFEVETDKTVVQVEAFGNGVLRRIIVPEGETVPIGTVLGIIADPEDVIE
jgi:pyruvate dehydrogenase E2 component (dihydrolipoamide acetyltransferase)